MKPGDVQVLDELIEAAIALGGEPRLENTQRVVELRAYLVARLEGASTTKHVLSEAPAFDPRRFHRSADPLNTMTAT